MSPRVRQPRRPIDWVAPGPAPAGARGLPELEPGENEDLCLLSGDWRIFQQQRGHRWSLDDLVTAHLAAIAVHPVEPERVLDLGCGIGSVLMMIAWRFPSARCTGIEAQDLSASMARRSLAYNGADDRCDVVLGDLRDASLLKEAGAFALVTGTPPYFVRGEGIESARPQCAPCRFEHRGGVADYCSAAARALAPRGRFVICAATGETERVREGAENASLEVLARLDVVPREGKAPLVSVFTMAHGPTAWPPSTRLVVRDAHGAWTPEFAEVRRAMGMPHWPPMLLTRKDGRP